MGTRVRARGHNGGERPLQSGGGGHNGHTWDRVEGVVRQSVPRHSIVLSHGTALDTAKVGYTAGKRVTERLHWQTIPGTTIFSVQ